MRIRQIECDLEDYSPDYDTDIPTFATKTVTVKDVGGKIDLEIDGHGLGEYDFGGVVNLEYWEGEVFITIYGDINSEEPTHRMCLDGARREKYLEDDDE